MRKTKYIHEDHYVAEVVVELQDADNTWYPTMSLDDAYKLDDVRAALKQGDVATASRQSVVFEKKSEFI